MADTAESVSKDLNFVVNHLNSSPFIWTMADEILWQNLMNVLCLFNSDNIKIGNKIPLRCQNTFVQLLMSQPHKMARKPIPYIQVCHMKPDISDKLLLSFSETSLSRPRRIILFIRQRMNKSISKKSILSDEIK